MNKKNDFEQDGFLALPGFFSEEELQAIEEALARFIEKTLPTLAPDHVFYEDKNDRGTLKQIQRVHEHDEFFNTLFQGKPKRLAEELLGEAVVGKNLQYFNKPPSVGQATPAHQPKIVTLLHEWRKSECLINDESSYLRFAVM